MCLRQCDLTIGEMLSITPIASMDDGVCCQCSSPASMRCLGCAGLLCQQHKVCPECDADQTEELHSISLSMYPTHRRRNRSGKTGLKRTRAS